MRYVIQFVLFTFLLSCQLGQTGNKSNTTDQSPINGQKFDAASKYSNATRSIWQKPEMVVELLGDLSGKTVADIGAGSGYFSFRIVFKADKVIAIDIDEYMIQLMETMRQNLPEQYKSRFETRLALPNDPLLLENEADIVIIVNTVAYISDRVNYFNTLKNGMKKGAKLMIMDFKIKNLPITAPPIEERVHLIDIEKELKQAGFAEILSDDTSLDYQYIVFAEKQ
jgi:ubiquinone/menaquinone biosynthesis C-methylase UbiE